jgi:Na+/melibiose symporter-like transporter
LSYVLEVLGDHSLPWTIVIELLAVACVLLGTYGWHASRVPAPVLALRLFGIRTFRVSVFGGFITRIGVGGMPFLLPLLYQVGLGFAPWQAGLLMMPQAISAIGMKLMSKPLLARFGYRGVLRVNTIAMGAMIMTFSFVSPATPVWGILLISLAQGLASSTQFTSINTLVYADVSDAEASRASSIASTGQQLALSFGVAFGSVAARWFLDGIPESDHAVFITALHHAFILLGIVTMISSASFASLRETDGSNVSQHKATFEALAEKSA